ncbi:type II secretion system F family protein [Vibrio brasiliensis]|jgi:tight adherence protein C|uniref:type II secretion system F family protein n=1 Tax=Vibrio brasiliensis TaxID=170652 RepID=UPI001EFCE7C2|nr:type II secretion system F family protein [Vibrio brasiliensis]MCG9748883.1 type II secretion system F family protein [Vibrio brasiliensis]MCG9782162.1 type II secretion system F family protein [Vibrio brasiliensis]
MTNQISIFITLVALVIGIAVWGYYLWKSIQRRSYLRNYDLIDSSKQTSKDNNIELVFDKLAASFATKEDDIQEKLEEAGINSQFVAKYYMHLKYGVSFAGLAAIYWLFPLLEFSSANMIVSMAIWFIASIIVPDSVLAARSKARREKISGQLPYLLDLMAICVQTGMTLEATIKYLAIELKSFDKDLAKLLAKVSDRANIVGLEKSLDELYLKLPTPEIRSFVMTLKQSLQYGSSIYTVLTTLAADIRDINMLTAEERIGKLAAKMSLPLILFIMFPIVIIILAPAAMRFMDHV